MTWTWTRARCTTSEQERKSAPCHTSLMLGHMHLVAQVLSPVIHVHVRLSLSSPLSLSASIGPSPSSPSSSLSCTPSSTLSSTTWSPCKTCAPPRTKRSNDACDVHTSRTSYEPNYMVFSELGDSHGSSSCITQSSDLDVDDATLGKLLIEAHRGQADYSDPEGVSVSQSSLSVVFDRTGNPVGERWIGWTWDFDGSINCSRWNNGRDSFAEWKPFVSSNSMATST